MDMIRRNYVTVPYVYGQRSDPATFSGVSRVELQLLVGTTRSISRRLALIQAFVASFHGISSSLRATWQRVASRYLGVCIVRVRHADIVVLRRLRRTALVAADVLRVRRVSYRRRRWLRFSPFTTSEKSTRI